MEEVKENPNCITKAFEEHPIFIFKEEKNEKKMYYFKALDVGKALNIVNIRTSIQNFDEDEVVVRTTYDTINREQDTLFLTSAGVYRLLYSSKKPLAKQFRKWANEILDDIIFNESKELKKKLDEKEQEKIEALKLLEEEKNKEIEETKQELQLAKENNDWLAEVTKKAIKFNIREEKSFIYVGSNNIDHSSYLEKIGNGINRDKAFRTGNSPENEFISRYEYDVSKDLAYPIETYLHKLFAPLHARMEGRTASEFFMAHSYFIDMIVYDLTTRSEIYIKYINDYIKILETHRFNYDSASEDVMKLCKISKNVENDTDNDTDNDDENTEREDNIQLEENVDENIGIMDNIQLEERSSDNIDNSLIKCTKCAYRKKDIDFGIKKDGTIYRTCISCRDNKLNRKRYKKAEQETETEKICSKCNTKQHIENYEFKEDGTRYVMCNKCRNKNKIKRLNNLKSEVLETFSKITPKNEEEATKFEELKNLLDNIKLEDFRKKPRINILGEYYRCCKSLTHEKDSLDAWNKLIDHNERDGYCLKCLHKYKNDLYEKTQNKKKLKNK